MHIFQANDLGCLMAHPKVGFLLSLQCTFNFYFHFCPQKLVVRTLPWDFKKVGPFLTLLLISLVAPAGYFMEICTYLVYVEQVK